MSLSSTPDYQNLRNTRVVLRMLAPIVGVSLLSLGLWMFAERAMKLLTTGFARGERVELGIWALIYLGGYGLAGVVAHRAVRAAADVIDLWVDLTVSSQKTAAILEEQLVPAIDRLAQSLKSQPAAKLASPPKPADLSNLSTTDLLDQLRTARRMGDPEEVLDLRESLMPRLPDGKRQQMDLELAGWFTKYFQKALRAGQAQVVVGPLARAVEALAEVVEMQHLAESLPLVRRSVGLCESCGKPYRGRDPQCPACKTEENSSVEQTS